VRIDDWHLRREAGTYRTRIASDDFALELSLAPTQPLLLQGESGFSRKGPDAGHASFYYSEPHLRVSGRVSTREGTEEVTGIAWLDHEWSSEPLAKEATGWDWLGVNLDDGGALMAFRIRARDGSTLWSNATLRQPGAAPVAFTTGIGFEVRRTWKSPRTGVIYPVAMDVRVGERTWRVEPLFDDQELDARSSTGTLYWEGAVRVQSPAGGGRGYLELTGYAERVPF
jgi:predicted secreted hydrolase